MFKSGSLQAGGYDQELIFASGKNFREANLTSTRQNDVNVYSKDLHSPLIHL